MADYNISEAFAVIEDYLIDSMRRNMLRHIGQEKREGISWSQWQTEMLSGLREYKRENADKFKGIYPVIEQKIEQAMWEAYDTGEAEQEQVILSAIRKGYTAFRPTNALNAEFFRMNRRKMNALVGETQKSMTKATHAALRMANDQYRSIIFGAQVFYNAGAGTLWQAVDMASKRFLQAGLNCIEYRNGNRVNIASYAEMALRTANTRAYLHGEAAKREQYGIHTVIVNRHNAACPLCVPFQGRVFIDDVWGGGTAAEAQVQGYPLLSEAMEAGLYHPNCKDGHTTFFVGINRWYPPTERMKEEQVRRYNLQQQQRYHERQIRKYKRLTQDTMDEKQRIKYTRKLHEWQNRTQKLIDANPTILRRSSPREQLRNIPEELGITPPRNPPGVEIFVNQPPEKPKDDKIRSVIDVKAYSRPKTPPPAIGPSEAERRRDIERIKAKTRLVRQKADELYIDAKIARYNAQVAARNADMAKQKANQISRAVRVKAILRDRLVFYQNNNAKLAIAKAKRLHSVAEIKKTEARASQRRYYTLMKLDNGGKLTVAVNTVSERNIPVRVKPANGAVTSVSTIINANSRTRWQRLENIIGQDWLTEIKNSQLDDVARMLHRMDDRRLRFLEKYGNLIKGDFYSDKDPHTIGDRFQLDFSRSDPRSSVLGYKCADIRVLLHESGHIMNNQLGISGSIKGLRAAMQEDFFAYASDLLGRNINGMEFSYQERMIFYEDLTDERKVGISDIISGLTKNRVHGTYGHSSDYWTEKTLISETIANMFEAYMNGDQSFKLMKQYFPRSSDLFERYINSMI